MVCMIMFYIDFYNFCRFLGAILFLRFGKVGKSSATKTSKVKKFEIQCGCHSLGHSSLNHGLTSLQHLIWPGGMREAIRRPTAGGAACWTPNQLGFVKYLPNLSSQIANLRRSRPRSRITPSLSLPRAPHIPPGRPQDVSLIALVAVFFEILTFQKIL